MRLFRSLLFCFILLLTASRATAQPEMAWAANADASSGTTITFTFAGAVSEGATLICFATGGHATQGLFTGVSDQLNGAWRRFRKGAPVAGGAPTAAFDGWYFPNSAAGTPTVTGTYVASTGNRSLTCASYAGDALVSGYVEGAGQYQTDPTTDTDAVRTGATGATPSDVAFAVSATIVASSVTLTAGTGWTSRLNTTLSTFAKILIQDKAITSPDTVESLATTSSATSDTKALVGVFREPGGSGVTTYYVRTDGHDTNCIGDADASDASTATVACAYLTIAKCSTFMAPGDTCIVENDTFDEVVTTGIPGTDENWITYRAATDCVSNSGTTVLGSACAKVRRILIADAYTRVQGFEVTGLGMTATTDRPVEVSATSNVEVLNTYLHHTNSSNGCFTASNSSNVLFRGVRVSMCAPVMAAFATILGPYNIQTGVNDKISLSVQGGAAQTFTLAADASKTVAEIDIEITAAGLTGATVCPGVTCEQILNIWSNTVGVLSEIEVLPIANSVYATLGMAEGMGEFQAGAPGFAAAAGTNTDILIEDSVFEYVSDGVNPGDGDRFVVRDSTFGPWDEFTATHLDLIQPGGMNQVLLENVRAVDGGNIQHHIMHNEIASTQYIFRGFSTCRHRGSTFMGTQSGQNYFYIYNSTYYDNMLVHPEFLSGGQMFSNVASMTRSMGRNNIWKNSTNTGNPVYQMTLGAADTDDDYDLWHGTTPSLASQAHDVNADPLVTDGANCDFTLTSSSPAKDAGGPLTTVHADDTGSGITLKLTDARMFQDGWAGITPDTIAVGTVDNIAQIDSIDYATGTVTLTSGISRNDGDSVWWYANSRGTRVLYGSAPDIGAFEYQDQGSGLVRIRIRP